MLVALKGFTDTAPMFGVLGISVRGGRFLAPGSFYAPFSERFDEESNRRPSPHPETPKFPDELPPPTGPRIADKRPFRIICQPRQIYWWCSCGQSKEQPFCDGHHARRHHGWPARNQRNMFKPIKVVFEKKTEVWFCTCKQTGSAPYCDGSHRCEQVQTAIKLSGFGWRALQWNAVSRRSIFPFFKSKTVGDTKSKHQSNVTPESDSDHAELIWAEATQDLVKDKLVKSSRNNLLQLKHSQIKQMKKAAFMDTIELYKDRSGTARRGFNEFILAALKQMEEYEVANDLESYKALLSVLPSGGRLRPSSFLHADMGAYKRQQDTVILMLMQLNAHQVLPDDDVGNTIVDVFGFKSQVMSQYRRLMYWVPKLRHTNPWPTLESLPDDLESESALRLAQLVAARISPDANTEFTTVSVENEYSPNCLVSAQSSTQRALLSAYSSRLNKESTNRLLYLDGPQFVWFRNLQLAYYTLWTDLDKIRLQKTVDISRLTTQSLASISDTATWDYRIHGSEKDTFKPLQLVYETSPTPVVTALPTLTNPSEAFLQALKAPKKSSLMRGGSTETAERRRALWAALKPAHELTNLPEKLTRHEQAEGTILGLGVVAPTSDALLNQRRMYERDTDLDDVGGKTSEVVVPAPAPERLIRQWLSDLQEANPGLRGTTVVLRHGGLSLLNEEERAQNRS